MIKKLTRDHKLINYYVSPANILVTENFEVRLVDFSLVDFYQESHNEFSTNSGNTEQFIDSLKD